MSEKRYSWTDAYRVAAVVAQELRPACSRVQIAGSLRRHKPDVGDVEILYIPTMDIEPDPEDLFANRTVSLADGRIEGLIRAGVLEKRKNVNGSEIFGEKNKLMRHIGTGIPVDLFAATEENWFNYLVCRTGPLESNIRICEAAQSKGWKWNPYGVGFSNTDGETRRMESEVAVFAFVGLPYHEPAGRIK
jgi:DNA polymerase/3'-5' exonuclease PolX